MQLNCDNVQRRECNSFWKDAKPGILYGSQQLLIGNMNYYFKIVYALIAGEIFAKRRRHKKKEEGSAISLPCEEE